MKENNIKTSKVNGITVAKVNDLFIGKIDPSRVGEKNNTSNKSKRVAGKIDKPVAPGTIEIDLAQYEDIKVVEGKFGIKVDNNKITFISERIGKLYKIYTKYDIKVSNCTAKSLEVENISGDRIDIEFIECHLEDLEATGNCRVLVKDSVVTNKAKGLWLDSLYYVHNSYVNTLDIKEADYSEFKSIEVQVGESVIDKLQAISNNELTLRVGNSVINKFRVKGETTRFQVRKNNIFICNRGELFGDIVDVFDYGTNTGEIRSKAIEFAKEQGYSVVGRYKSSGTIDVKSSEYLINDDKLGGIKSGIKYNLEGKRQASDWPILDDWTVGLNDGVLNVDGDHTTESENDGDHTTESENSGGVTYHQITDEDIENNPDIRAFMKINEMIESGELSWDDDEEEIKRTSQDIIGDIDACLRLKGYNEETSVVRPKAKQEDLDNVDDITGFLFSKENKLNVDIRLVRFMNLCSLMGERTDSIPNGAVKVKTLVTDSKNKATISKYDSKEESVAVLEVGGEIIDIAFIADDWDMIANANNSEFNRKLKAFQVLADMDKDEKTQEIIDMQNKLVDSCDRMTLKIPQGTINVVILGDDLVAIDAYGAVTADNVSEIIKSIQ